MLRSRCRDPGRVLVVPPYWDTNVTAMPNRGPCAQLLRLPVTPVRSQDTASKLPELVEEIGEAFHPRDASDVTS